MPKSKRNKIVSLTQVKAKRKELKTTLVENVRDALDKYSTAFVFSFENMRTSLFKDLRQSMAEDSRFFLGKNRVMQKALGSSADDEHRPHLSKLAADLRGNVGLLLTNRSRAEVEAAFSACEQPDFARAGCVATETVTVPRGKLDKPHTMVEELRKLGMSSLRLEKGTPVLTLEHCICTRGDVLSPEQCRLLKHFGHQLAVFQLSLVSVWADGVYEELDDGAARGRLPAKAASSKTAAGGGGDDDDDEEEEEGCDSDDEMR